MSVLQGVLEEELNRLENNISSYEETLNSLPRGSLFIRKMGNSSFAYRKWKENGKVISEYLGNIDDEKVKREIDKSNEYKRIKNNLKIAKQEFNILKRAIKSII